MHAGLDTVCSETAKLVICGPFHYGGRYTYECNTRFDHWLKSEDAQRGIRDFAAVNTPAMDIGLTLMADRTMSANNRCIIWQRTGAHFYCCPAPADH